MYVRRKVFSILQDENGEEKLFSVNDVILNDYEEQREFGKKEDEEEEGLSTGAKAAIGAGAGLVGTAGLIYGGNKLGHRVAGKAKEILEGNRDKAGKFLTKEAKEKLARRVKVGEAIAKPGDVIADLAGKGGKAIKDESIKLVQRGGAIYAQTKDGLVKVAGKVSNATRNVGNAISDATKKVVKNVGRGMQAAGNKVARTGRNMQK